MILMSPSVRLGKTSEERAAFLQKVKLMEVKTVTTNTPADWSDADVEEAKRFLDDHGIRVGEFSGHQGGFGSADPDEYRAAIEGHRRQLRHAHIIGAHCIACAILIGRIWIDEMPKTFAERGGTIPAMWSEETWKRCISAVEELMPYAEEFETDVAIHPHIITPVYSVERYQELFDAVPSPRLKALFDPVNMTGPHMFLRMTDFINEIFDGIGDKIVTMHAKDATMWSAQPISIISRVDEAVPGTGMMDYATILRRLDALDNDVPVHVEHFPELETIAGQQHIRHVGREIGVTIG